MLENQSRAPLEGSRSQDDAAELQHNPDAFWLARSRDAYTSGRDWFDTSIRRQIERNLAHFRNQHAPGSKYHTDVYAKRSRVFRPKARGMVRRTEAAIAVAFFSTQDLVHVSAVNPSNRDQRDSAEVKNNLLNYRLENTLPWFQILLGGAQDAAVNGVVISKQYWQYEYQDEAVLNVFEEEDGTLTYEEGNQRITRRDKPRIDLIPIENLILDPASDWLDPINSSPYLIELVPMYVWEIEEKARKINPRTGRPEYREVERKFVAAAIHQDWDSIRKMREGVERIDKYDNATPINQYQVVWVRKTIVRVDGRDWCYDTLGAEVMLSDPEPIEDLYPHLEGEERPYSMGMMAIEAHKLYPMAPLAIVDGMVEEINDLANLRLDNVKLALNARSFVKRGAQVDLVTLLRNVPGSAVYMNNPQTDVVETRAPDVTRSSYEEQDRLNVEFDEVAGQFSGASVNSNRRLNETVGGMSMLSADANQIKEYEVRTFSETWVEKVMRHLVQMEAYYESDAEILNIVATSAGIPVERAVQVLKQRSIVRCNVGFAATSPQNRVGRLMTALDTLFKFRPDLVQQLDMVEIQKEVFGALGYRDGSRFMPVQEGQDPRVAQLEQMVAELQAQLESQMAVKQMEVEGRIAVAEINAQAGLAKTEMQVGMAARLGEIKAMIDAKRMELEEFDRRLAIEQNEMKRRELQMARESLSHEINADDREFLLQLRQLVSAEQQSAEGKTKPKSGGDNLAGVISRGRFGMIPGQSDGVKPP